MRQRYIHTYIHTYKQTYIHTYRQTGSHTSIHTEKSHTAIYTYIHTYILTEIQIGRYDREAHIHTYIRTYGQKVRRAYREIDSNIHTGRLAGKSDNRGNKQQYKTIHDTRQQGKAIQYKENAIQRGRSG